MPDNRLIEQKNFLVTVTLSPSELGLYAAVRRAKKLTNDEAVSVMVAFCLQLLVSELSSLGSNRPLAEDLERTIFNLTAHLKQASSLLGGAEKILLDAAALREQLAQESRRAA